MTSISATSSASSAWSDTSTTPRVGGHKHGGGRAERMFEKADTNDDGSVDATELQSVLDQYAQASGTTAVSATDAMTAMDTDGNGSLSASELDKGMKSLMPPPSSTMDFAQRMGADGPPPPTPADASSASSGDASSDLSSALDKLFSAIDTNGDQSISTSEAQTFKDKVDNVIQGLQGGDSTCATVGSSSSSGSSSSGSSTSDNSTSDTASQALTAFIDLVMKQYAQTDAASASSTASTSSLSVSA